MRAEITEALILRLRLVIDHGTQEGIVLHYRVVDLAPEEIDSAFHRIAHSKIVERPRCTRRAIGGAVMESESAREDSATQVEEVVGQRDVAPERLVLEGVQERTLELATLVAVRQSPQRSLGVLWRG